MIRAIFDVSAAITQGIQLPLGADYAALSTNAPRWPFFMIVAGIVGLALSTAFTTAARPLVPPSVDVTPKRSAEC